MAILKTEAIVLKTFDFRETSIIANFFTSEYGRIKGILKGIRGNPKKFGSTLEPFSCNEIVFYTSRHSEIHLVSQCDLKENFNAIRQDLRSIMFASYTADLIDNLMPLEQKNYDSYSLVFHALGQINSGIQPEKVLRIFLIKFLKLIGFRPRLDGCINCQKGVTGGDAFFNVKRGGLLCARCKGVDTNSQEVLKGTVASILHMEKCSWDEALRLGLSANIKEELIRIMHSFMEFHLQVRPKSKRILDLFENHPPPRR